MLTLKTIMSQIRVGDWFVMVDLKYAYLHIQVVRRHRKFLCFALKGRLINTNFFPLAWLWRQGHSQNAWMLPWPPWGSRAFVYSITWMISSFWPTSGISGAITGMLSSTTFLLLVSEQTPRRVFSPTLNKLCFCEFTWIPFKYRPVWPPARISSLNACPASPVLPLGLLYMRPFLWG